MTRRSARSTCASRRTVKRWVYGASTTGIVLGGCPGLAWNITPNLTGVPSFRSALLNPRADFVGNEERRRLILLHQQTVSNVRCTTSDLDSRGKQGSCCARDPPKEPRSLLHTSHVLLRGSLDSGFHNS